MCVCVCVSVCVCVCKGGSQILYAPPSPRPATICGYNSTGRKLYIKDCVPNSEIYRYENGKPSTKYNFLVFIQL